MRNELLSVVGGSGTGLCVEFVWRGDRFGHAFSLVNRDGIAAAVLESVEGDGGEPWPTSPPLQHLHFENQAGGGRVALLVGMAGRNHWSASIEADPAAGAIVFDIACRVSDANHRLGSRYRVSGEMGRFHCAADSSSVDIRLDEASIVLTPDLQPACAAQFEVKDERQLNVVPLSSATAGTTRWKYRLTLAD
jgi:hypothetical protein